ncbi:MAG: protease modulator HflC [Phycisphaerae bacterium]
MRNVLTLIVLAAVVALAVTCFFVVDQTQYVVQMRFGGPVHTLIEPGLRLKWPWPVDTLVRFDNRLMVLENPAPGQPDKEYLTQDEQSGIGKNVIVTTYTCWRIKRDQAAVLRFLETMGDRTSAEARLGDVVVSELGAALGRHDFLVLVSTDPKQRRWVEFVESIRTRCSERVEESYGIEIVDVKIQRLNFPGQNRRNVFERMRAERETIATRYRSEGDEEATKIRAQANRQRVEILAKAYEKAERIRGEADAEAARIYAEAYGQDPEFYDFIRTLEAYEKTLNEKTVAILSGNSDFLRLLNRASESTAEPPVQPISEPAGE